VTQAGVSIGLAKEVGETFPDWGDGVANLLISVIVLNQVRPAPSATAAVELLGLRSQKWARRVKRSRSAEIHASPDNPQGKGIPLALT
jgi:hypothetical protein